MGAKAREGSRDRPEVASELVTEPKFRAEPGSLYVVATPIGNLRDLTFRARDILATVDVIAAEDTRVTAVLLAHYGVSTRPTPVHAHNERRRVQEIVELLRAGRSAALVCDAGTPAISDPGTRVVRAVREAGHRVVPIPGPAALTAAVSASGVADGPFVFAGFLPAQAQARRQRVVEVASLPYPIVLYEAPHRVRATVAELAQALPDREIVVARELTKAFETISRLPLAKADAWFAADSNRERGEFVLIVDAPRASAPAAVLSPEIERWLAALLEELPPARAARVAAKASGVPRASLYARAQVLKGEERAAERRDDEGN